MIEATVVMPYFQPVAQHPMSLANVWRIVDAPNGTSAILGFWLPVAANHCCPDAIEGMDHRRRFIVNRRHDP